MVIIQLEEIVRRLGLRVFRIQYINIHNWCYSNPFYYHNQSQWDSTRLKFFLLSTLIYTHLLQKDKYIHVNIHLTICMYEDVYASPTYNARGTYANVIVFLIISMFTCRQLFYMAPLQQVNENRILRTLFHLLPDAQQFFKVSSCV